MTATIYTNFMLYKWKHDVELWYRKHYYPKGHDAITPVMDEHLRIMDSHYDYDTIEGNNVQEKRINFLNFCQKQTERSFMRID